MTKRSKILIWFVLAGLVFMAGAFIVFSFAFSTTGAKPNVTRAAPPIATTSPTTPSTPLPTGFEPESASFPSSDIGFVLGTARCPSGSCLTIARTRDGGSTWSAIPAPNISLIGSGDSKATIGAVSKIRFLTINDGYLFGPDLYATHDGGTTWKRIVLLGIAKDSQVTSLETNGSDTYLIAGIPNAAVGHKFLFISSKSSDAFIIQVTPVLSSEQDAEITSNRYGVVISNSNDKNIFFYQETGRKNWLQIHVRCSDHLDKPLIALASPVMALTSPQIVLACGSNAAAGSQEKTIFESKDLKAFEATRSQPPQSGIIEEIASPDGKTIAVAASSGATFLYVSTNGGVSWQTVISDPSFGGASIHDLGFTTPTQGFAIMGHATTAGTRSSAFLMTRDQGVSWHEIGF